MTGAGGTGAGAAVGGAGTARRPSLLDTEDLSQSGGWTRDASGHLVPPPPKAPPAPEPAPATTPPRKATGNPPAARPGRSPARRSRPRPRPRTVGAGPVRVTLPGTTGGLLLALITYPVFIAWVRGGNPAVKSWFSAKFLNKVPGATQAGTGKNPADSIYPHGVYPTWGTPSGKSPFAGGNKGGPSSVGPGAH